MRATGLETAISVARNEIVTISVVTHVLNEAERCHRISLTIAGTVLATDAPTGLLATRKGGIAGGSIHPVP